jgi:hypothetical protein
VKINQSGQVLVLSAFILIIMLIVIPIMVFVNAMATRHGTQSQAALKGRVIAQEGAAFAIQQLKASGSLNCQGHSFDGVAVFQSAQGGAYTIHCINGPLDGQLQSYQDLLTVRPLNTQGQFISGSPIASTVSPLTIGARLPTGYTASAALEVMHVPNEAAGAELDVELGPIVSRDSSTWTLDALEDTSRRPRKFSSGCIAQRNSNCASPTSPFTDQREYWDLTSPGFAAVIDTASYRTIAQDPTVSICSRPTCSGGCSGGPLITATPSGSCYFQVAKGDSAIFDIGWTGPGANGVIYVDGGGDVVLNQIKIILANNSAFIVDGGGRLTLGDNHDTAGPYASPAIPLPPTAAKDDPYGTCGGVSPCNGTTTRNLDFQGFLYATGDLEVAQATYWTLDGVVRVEGTLSLAGNANVLLFYNDTVNHSIRTTNFEIQMDSTTAASPAM